MKFLIATAITLISLNSLASTTLSCEFAKEHAANKPFIISFDSPYQVANFQTKGESDIYQCPMILTKMGSFDMLCDEDWGNSQVGTFNVVLNMKVLKGTWLITLDGKAYSALAITCTK